MKSLKMHMELYCMRVLSLWDIWQTIRDFKSIAHTTLEINPMMRNKVHVVHLWEVKRLLLQKVLHTVSTPTSYEDDQAPWDFIHLHFTQLSRYQCYPVSCIESFVSSKQDLEIQWAGYSKSSPSLVKFGTNAYPLKSLSGVLDSVSNATVKSQWPRQRIQVVEELCNEKGRQTVLLKHLCLTQCGNVNPSQTLDVSVYLYSPVRGCLPPPSTHSCTGHCW